MKPCQPVLLCFAVPQEARLFQSHAPSLPQVIPFLTGIGAQNALNAIQKALQTHHPALVISSGFAGGLAPHLPTSSVVFDADPAFPLAHRLCQSGAIPARFLASNRIISSAAEKQRLWQSSQADAVDMESKAIRDFCSQRGIPSATVRVISDAANEDLPLDFNQCMTPDMRLDYLKLISLIIYSPTRLIHLIRFQTRLAKAGRALAISLAHTLQSPSPMAGI